MRTHLCYAHDHTKCPYMHYEVHSMNHISGFRNDLSRRCRCHVHCPYSNAVLYDVRAMCLSYVFYVVTASEICFKSTYKSIRQHIQSPFEINLSHQLLKFNAIFRPLISIAAPTKTPTTTMCLCIVYRECSPCWIAIRYIQESLFHCVN